MLAGCQTGGIAGAAGPIGQPEGPWREQTHLIPLPGTDPPVLLAGRVCRPPGEAPARVVVIAHGSPPQASARPRMHLTSCSSEAVSWFLSHGDIVVLSLRRGYGATGGTRVEGVGDCSTEAYVRSAQEAARDVAATLAYGLGLPYARHDGAIVVGQSVGGWATLGLNSLPHPDVIALVSMAGGHGGHHDERPNNNCQPQNLAAAAGVLGHTASTPMLWIYTENDSFFAPPIAAAMYRQFTEAGGVADMHALPAFDDDGHTLFFGRGGAQIWGPLMQTYLQSRGAL